MELYQPLMLLRPLQGLRLSHPDVRGAQPLRLLSADRDRRRLFDLALKVKKRNVHEKTQNRLAYYPSFLNTFPPTVFLTSDIFS